MWLFSDIIKGKRNSGLKIKFKKTSLKFKKVLKINFLKIKWFSRFKKLTRASLPRFISTCTMADFKATQRGNEHFDGDLRNSLILMRNSLVTRFQCSLVVQKSIMRYSIKMFFENFSPKLLFSNFFFFILFDIFIFRIFYLEFSFWTNLSMHNQKWEQPTSN